MTVASLICGTCALTCCCACLPSVISSLTEISCSAETLAVAAKTTTTALSDRRIVRRQLLSWRGRGGHFVRPMPPKARVRGGHFDAVEQDDRRDVHPDQEHDHRRNRAVDDAEARQIADVSRKAGQRGAP